MSTEANLRVRAECREWLMLIHSGDANDADHVRFNAWLQTDPRHQRAYTDLQALWNEIGGLHELADLEPVPPPRARTPRVRTSTHVSWAAAAGIAALALLAVWNRREAPPANPIADVAFDQTYLTAVAEVREVSLPDGSTLTLGARSQASVSFTESERRVRLGQGEAYFAVAKNPSKPFYVDAGNATVRVIGTHFDVHRGSGHVRIAVAEGVVAVNGSHTSLTGGQLIDVLPNGALTQIETVTDNSIGAWREGRLIYENASLQEVVTDLSRYRGDVDLRSGNVGALRVTAGLHVDQIDQFLDGLPAILPVRVIRNGTSITIDERG